MRMQLKYDSEDSGLHRTYYVNKKGDMYCRQEDYNNVFNWYFSTEESEPLSEVEDTHIDIVKSFNPDTPPPTKIEEFMKLPDEEKEKYWLRIEDGNEFDIKTFSGPSHMLCEMCGERTRLIGTSDTREPKFCFKHYALLNKDSEFIRKEQRNKIPKGYRGILEDGSEAFVAHKQKEKTMNHTITLSSIDIGHILDGLRCRAEAWKNTLDYLESGTEPDGLIEECNSAKEAQQIADHYNSIIETIEKQIRK